MTETPAFIGIDVAKDELVVAVRRGGARWTVAQTDAAWHALATRLRARGPPWSSSRRPGASNCPWPASSGAPGSPSRW